jgi:hypothetical protein
MNKLKFLVPLLFFAQFSEAQESLSLQSLKSHPRLFAYDSRIAAIKTQTDSVTKQLLAILKADAEQRLNAKPVVYPGDLSNMGTSRNVQGRIISLALAYRIFGDKRLLRKAKEELLQLAAVGNWGTGHFLDVGEASLAAGIGYDWLYNDLTAAERKTVAEAIKTKALVPGLQAKEGGDSWVNGNFNWNPVCNGGLMVGALAIADEEPEIAKQIISRAIKNIPTAGEAYSPDGSFAEGPSYWSYGTSFYVLAVEALRSCLGSSFNLQKIPGFLKTADYTVQMKAPTGEKYNYSDYHIEIGNEPIMLWFAGELDRPDLAANEVADIAHLYRQWQNGVGPTGRSFVQSRHTPFELLWWKPSLLKKRSNVQAPLQWSASGLMPISVMRSAWNDSLATFVAIKGGTPDNSHGHMDAGSFILEANGVRWALDLGTESYGKMEQAKLDLWNYSQTSNRWTTFRAGPEGHNILRFDGERQLISGKGEVKQMPSTNGSMGAEADLTSLYSNKAKKVSRKIVLNADRSVSIQDDWTAKDNAVTVSFQWLTKATVTKTAHGFLLQQAGKSLDVVVEEPQANVSIDVQDVSKSKAVQDSDNPGLSRIVISTKTAAGAKGDLHLRASAKK